MLRTPLAIPLLLLLALAAPPGAAQEAGVVERTFDLSFFLESPEEPAPEWLGLHGSGESAELDLETPEEVDAGTYPEVLQELLGESDDLVLTIGWDELHAAGSPAAVEALARRLDAIFLDVATRVEVEVDVLSFTAETLDRLAAGGRLESLRRGRLDAAGLAAVREAAGPRGPRRWTGAAVAASGRFARTADLRSTSYVMDLDVEIAQGSVVGDPIVAALSEGVSVFVRPFRLSDGGVFLEAFVQQAALEGAIRRVNVEAAPLGAIDFPALAVERWFAAGRVRPGETLAMFRQGGSGPNAAAALLLTPRIRPERRPAGNDPIPAAALLFPRLGARAAGALDEYGEPEGDRLSLVSAPGAIFELGGSPAIDGVLTELPAAVFGTSIHVLSPDAREAVAGRVAAREAAIARSHRVRLTARGGPAPAEVYLDVPVGRPVFHLAGVERAYLADWDVEVAQESRIGDPIVATTFGGLVANLRLDAAPSGGAVAGRLSIAMADLSPAFEVRPTGNELVGIVEMPELRRYGTTRDFLVAPGEVVTIDAGLDDEGRPRTFELEILAR